MIRGVDVALVIDGETIVDGGRENGNGEGSEDAVLKGSRRDGEPGDQDSGVNGLEASLDSWSEEW